MRRLEAYLDGELAPREMEAAGAHLADCLACRQALEERRAFGSLVREHLEVAAPPELKASILASAEDAAPVNDLSVPKPVRSPVAGASFCASLWESFLAGWSRRRVVPVLAAATALLAVVIVQRIVSDGSDPGVAGHAMAFSRPGRVIVLRYGESPAGQPARGTEEETVLGGLVLDDPR